MRDVRRELLPLLFMLAASVIQADPQLDVVLSPDRWDFGTVVSGRTVSGAVTASNTGTATLRVTLVPACGCLRADPQGIELAPGGSGVFRLTYDSTGELGIVEKAYIVNAQGGGPAGSRLLAVTGIAIGPQSMAGAGAALPDSGMSAPAPDASGISVFYYYTPGCRSCERFLSDEIPALEKKLGIRITVEKRDAMDPAVFEEMEEGLKKRGAQLGAFPVLVSGDSVLQGEAEIREKLAVLLAAASGTAPAAAGADKAEGGAVTEGLAVIPVLAGGLLDGINPCAFTTLIFLLASLALAGRGRKEVLVIGLLFSLSVFATYTAIGFGFFAALRAASSYAPISLALRWILFAVLLVFAGLSFFDFLKIRAGKPSEILLQLPLALKQRIHSAIRTRVRAAALAGSSLALGFLVSVFEFACTGQVYLPTLAYLVRVQARTRAVLLLLVYNLGFIAPLLAVFAAAYFGVGSEKVADFFKRRMAGVKIGLALFFLGLAAITLAG
jgi:cytochrome c biogenesis protein CcdA